jgi:ppGpp synthetase/RelA/SpoT-type nucleotidyltranferase
MQWAEPSYPKKRVNWAGRGLLKELEDTNIEDFLEANKIVNNWRASHSFPLNTFQIGLRKKASSLDQYSVVAQRIKRLPSIYHKLTRFSTMTLSQMQDIGGCRAILSSTDNVMQLCDLYEKSRMKHDLHHKDDYIINPKESGYRGIHLVYRYKSDKKDTYNGLLIEMQLRSTSQHAWATAVETVGTFVGQALKSSMGHEDWLDFFRLMATGIAHLEKTPPVPNTPNDPMELHANISNYVAALEIFERLNRYSETLQIIEEHSTQNQHFFLIELDAAKQQTVIRTFGISESEKAAEQYSESEEKNKVEAGTDVVLVSVDSIAQLKRAYPNYFADTKVFLELVKEVLSTLSPS